MNIIMKIILRIGIILFILGTVAADSPNLLWPIGMIFAGVFLVKISGGMKNF